MRKYFLGGNTPRGFYSYYDSLISQNEARKIYVIKGGPGTGKSTLMKAVSSFAVESGYNVDHIYCSSDPDSLDGLVIPEMKVAFVDGTSPHMVDPKSPGAVDTIVNLGDCWNEKNMRKNKEDIISINKKISEKFSLSYDHLEAAGVLHNTAKKILSKVVDKELLERTAGEIIFSEITEESPTGKAGQRKLFASSYGPKGYISFADTIGCSKKYVLRGYGTNAVLDKVAMALMQYGYDTELFMNPLCPENEILHLYVPELDLGIFTGESESGVTNAGGVVMDLSHLADRYLMDEYAQELDSIRRALSAQIKEACDIIKEAKTLHDSLEKCYVPNMDFAKSLKIEEKIIKELEEMI